MHISGCSSRAAAAAPIVPRSLCAEYCAGDLPGRSTIDGLLFMSVTMHACTCSDRSAIATGRTYEDSVTRHRKICRRRACYVKTLATDRVLSDANERARYHWQSGTCIHDEHIIDGRKGGHAGLWTLPLCGLRLLPPSAAGNAGQHRRGPARSPAVAQFTA
jgi:hypothetical protein